ncbi:hypothetical protein CRM22_009610 [Opisthorchis felineus]|uniref:Uncharacterized protein n=1 Tax=Opisthorchis felineus TaxID=147828 RepID=A0A4S2LE03_OPIFE|nr:hypothetical protein CRM22_009610 [Opisthorchis felineus]
MWSFSTSVLFICFCSGSYSLPDKGCCIRGRQICSALKISVAGFNKACETEIPSVTTFAENGFYVEQNYSLLRGYYAILIWAPNGLPKPDRFRQTLFLYAAMNVHDNCFKKNVPCKPQHFRSYQFECSEQYEMFRLLDIFLLPQTSWITGSNIRLMTSNTYDYKNFYNRTLFRRSPDRCNRLVLRACRHLPRYDKLLHQHERRTPLGLPLDPQAHPSTLHSIFHEHFPGIVVSHSMIKFEEQTCFLSAELENQAIAKEESLYMSLSSCTDPFVESTSPIEYAFNLTIIANHWFIYAQQEYVHYQILKKYISDLKMFHDFEENHIVLQRGRDNKRRMGRIVARLQLIFDRLVEMNVRWTPPFIYLRNTPDP